MLNKTEPKMESYGTPNNISCHKPYESFTRNLWFCLISSYELISKQVKLNGMRLASE